MKEVIQSYKNKVVQIATPLGSGTGLIVSNHNIIVTNRHVIFGNNEVVIKGDGVPKQKVKVIFTDSTNDIAFLEYNSSIDAVSISPHEVVAGESIIAIGHPLGLEFTATQGIVSKAKREFNNVDYIQVDAAINPGNSGGPLINENGEIVGINTFIYKNGQSLGFALPSGRLLELINEYEDLYPNRSSSCHSCTRISTIDQAVDLYCQNCGTKFQEDEFNFKPYLPGAVQTKIENILKNVGKDPEISRVGNAAWDVEEGSSLTKISYDEKSKFIYADAVLGTLPKDNLGSFYEYLLKENYDIDNSTFSISKQNVMLSTIIFQDDLNEESGTEIFGKLFTLADHYDDILADQFGLTINKN